MKSMKLPWLSMLVSLAACQAAAHDSPDAYAKNVEAPVSTSTPHAQSPAATTGAQVAQANNSGTPKADTSDTLRGNTTDTPKANSGDTPKANSGEAAKAQAGDGKVATGAVTQSSAATAKDPAVDEARQSKLDALRKEYTDAMNAYYELLRNAKTPEEQAKVAAEHKAPDTALWTPRFWELVNEDPKDDVALGALTWLYESSHSKPDADRALGIIMKEQIQSPKLAPFCDRFASGPPGPREFLERVLAENPSRDVRGHALYALAKMDLASADLAQRIAKAGADAGELNGLKSYVGEERYAAIAKLDVAKTRTGAEALVERVAAEYGDVKFRSSTLGETAKADLHEMRDLVVGKPAPEIEAEDIGGTPFKLSDYRGKVVLLDFWGNW